MKRQRDTILTLRDQPVASEKELAEAKATIEIGKQQYATLASDHELMTLAVRERDALLSRAAEALQAIVYITDRNHFVWHNAHKVYDDIAELCDLIIIPDKTKK